MPKPVSLSRFIPTGEEERWLRRVAVSRLYLARTDRRPHHQPPAHGAVTFVNATSFPNYIATSQLSSCNEKKSSGLKIDYKSEDGYVGADGAGHLR